MASCVATVGLAGLFSRLQASSATDEAFARLPAPVSAGSPSSTTAAASPASTPPVATATPAAFDGSVIDTPYGPVQVQLQIAADSRGDDVAVIEYPDGAGRSVRINARALPTLRTEAVTTHSASIDTVSGATYTSDAYRRSLQFAIDQAVGAGATGWT